MPIQCKRRIAVTFCSGILCLGVLQGQSNDDAPSATVAPSMDEQAHRLLDSALKINGLFSDDLKPWHLTATVTDVLKGSKLAPQKVEVWSAGRYRWRSSVESEGKRSVRWSTSRTQSYKSHHFYNTAWEPFTNPLQLAGYLRPGIELELKHLEIGVSLDCISVMHPERYARSVVRAFYPSLCFDKKMRLRLLSVGQVVTQYDSYRIFQGREVAEHVKMTVHGDTLTEAKLDSLDMLDKVDEKILTPDQNAIKDYYTRQPSDPDPVVTHQEAAAISLATGKVRPNVLVLISAILQKDGSVKATKKVTVRYRQADGQMTEVVGAVNEISDDLLTATRLEPINAAAGRWKFEPYMIDGEIVEVPIDIPFTEDGKPLKP